MRIWYPEKSVLPEILIFDYIAYFFRDARREKKHPGSQEPGCSYMLKGGGYI
jgi:hypothetical protein